MTNRFFDENGPGERFEGCVCLQDDRRPDCPAIETGKCHFQGAYEEDARRAKWDARFMELARLVAGWSKDRGTRVGCVLADELHAVLSLGYNGLPRGVRDDADERHAGDAQHLWTVHAEQNSLCDAARRGARVMGATAYVCWFPCAQCAVALIQAGVSAVVCYEPDLFHPRYGAGYRVALAAFGEAGVSVRYVAGERLRAKE